MISSLSSGQSALGTGRPMLTRYSEEEVRGSQAVPCSVPVLDLTAVPLVWQRGSWHFVNTMDGFSSWIEASAFMVLWPCLHRMVRQHKP